MRSWKVLVLCTAALIVLASLLIGQQQGPLKDPGGATVAKPRKSDDKKDGDGDLPKIPSAYKRDNVGADPGTQPSFKADVDMVTLDVAVLDNKGHFIPGIPKGNFRVLEDNVPQQVKGVTMGEAPLTISMVIEFSNRFQQYWGPVWYQTLQLVWGFASTLKPEDYVAVVAYDIKPEILSDFTTDRSKTQEALSRLQIAAWSEANLFDAITDTADRMSSIEGRKAIVLITSGIDTFSKITFDQTRKKLQESGVPIYAIGLMQTLRMLMEARGYMGPIANMDFLQADNELKTFAKETGGQAYFPRFEGESPAIFQAIHQALRNQYVITYQPINKAHDGTYRKLKVELVNPATNEPLPVKDEKGKPIKYSIVAKAGYKAPREVE
ncbi:MAG TPA: VWA domain-containing protein [Bryobacteraceae bacterium]|jgi:VWFA-related protein|nr:VWA domain-containing protein [Bryobacteraceae bacterium]